uniref:Uncharacterized protein n=1 Tax=Panagrolaimus sp. JU765 TaxID=591449 RepID=A0AC34RGI0_9BILA
MHLFVVLFSAVFTVLQIHGYTCRVRSKLVNDHGGCDILFASHNPERKCLNYCYIGTKNEYSGEIIYIESVDSSNSFNWTVMAGTTKLESHSIVMKEIYNFEIIGGNYVKGIISLLVQTQELLFAVFIDVISPNVYDAIVIECYVNFIELSSLKNCSNVCYIGKRGEKLIFFASNGTFGQFYWLYITTDGDIHYLKMNLENNSANAEQLAENMTHFAQAAISDDDIFFLLVSSNKSNTMENARWFVINYETLMVNKTLSFTRFPKHLHNVEIFGGNLTYICKNKNITKPIADVIDFYNAQPIC